MRGVWISRPEKLQHVRHQADIPARFGVAFLSRVNHQFANDFGSPGSQPADSLDASSIDSSPMVVALPIQPARDSSHHPQSGQPSREHTQAFQFLTVEGSLWLRLSSVMSRQDAIYLEKERIRREIWHPRCARSSVFAVGATQSKNEMVLPQRIETGIVVRQAAVQILTMYTLQPAIAEFPLLERPVKLSHAWLKNIALRSTPEAQIIIGAMSARLRKGSSRLIGR